MERDCEKKSVHYSKKQTGNVPVARRTPGMALPPDMCRQLPLNSMEMKNNEQFRAKEKNPSAFSTLYYSSCLAQEPSPGMGSKPDHVECNGNPPTPLISVVQDQSCSLHYRSSSFFQYMSDTNSGNTE